MIIRRGAHGYDVFGSTNICGVPGVVKTFIF